MTELADLYRVEQLPVLQNRVFSSAEEAINCETGDLALVQDTKTGLIFNDAFRPELMVYDENYQNEQATSAKFQSHLDSVASLIRANFVSDDVIEVGCGKGFFLQKLTALGFRVIGVDPTYEGDDPGVIKKFFGRELGIRAEGIVLRHVLEHVQDPVSFLKLIRDANQGSGTIYIEVPCFDWICHRRAWFDVFYEHVNYFRLSDFHRMFGTVYKAGHTFDGQYLYVLADIESIRDPVNDEDPFDFPSDFRNSIGICLEKMRCEGKARNSRDTESKAIVWGAASKGVIFSLFMSRAGASIDSIIDINPAKQNRFVPSTGLEVRTPEWAMAEMPANGKVFVMNSNYLGEIKDLTNDRFTYLVPDEFSI